MILLVGESLTANSREKNTVKTNERNAQHNWQKNSALAAHIKRNNMLYDAAALAPTTTDVIVVLFFCVYTPISSFHSCAQPQLIRVSYSCLESTQHIKLMDSIASGVVDTACNMIVPFCHSFFVLFTILTNSFIVRK